MSASELLNAVLQLPIEDRRELIYKAWASLEDDDASLHELPGLVDSAEFAAEIERRLDAAKKDSSQLCDGNKVLLEARQLVGGRKPC